jgi:hypothetical protein
VIRRVLAPRPRGISLSPAFALLLLVTLRFADVPLSMELTGKSETSLTDDVVVSADGNGRATGVHRRPVIEWQSGTVHVEVTPGAGVDLRVETREASIHVVGTGFDVTRDVLGTRTEVQHGRVEVRCGTDAPLFLDAGDGHTCEPVSAAGMLARARALGAGEAALDAISRGLLLATDDPAASQELEALRVRFLVDLRRFDEAVRAADAFLSKAPRARTDEVRALVAPLRETR